MSMNTSSGKTNIKDKVLRNSASLCVRVGNIHVYNSAAKWASRVTWSSAEIQGHPRSYVNQRV